MDRERLAVRPLFAALAVLLAGCAPDSPVPAGAVADDAGRLHAAAEPRDRIISLVPSVTETLVAMGAAERLIARTRYDEHPELASLPVVSGVLEPSVEVLAAMSPDLIVMWPSDGDGGAIGGKLDDVGIDWYGSAIQSVADFERHAHNLGRLTGLESEAESVIASVQADLLDAGGRWSGRSPVSIFYVVQMDPPRTVGPGTFLDSVFVAGGAANVFGNIEGHWPRVSFEDIVRRNPDYVVVPVAGYGTPRVPSDHRDPSLRRLASSAAWSLLPAVAEGRVVSVDASLFGRPGPRMGEAARYLACRIHGLGDGTVSTSGRADGGRADTPPEGFTTGC